MKENDLPDALARRRARDAKQGKDRSAKRFMVPMEELEAKDFDLSINRHIETRHKEVTHEHPAKILARMRALEAEIARDLSELEAMLGDSEVTRCLR